MLKITFYLHGRRAIPRVISSSHDLLYSTKIPLSRKGGSCYYCPANFRRHDECAPRFHNRRERKAYIDRVTADILAAWDKVKPKEAAL